MMIRNTNLRVSALCLSGLFTIHAFAQTNNYDPKKDPAYAGYKYRPGQGFTQAKHKLPPRPSCVKEVKTTIRVSGTFDGKGCLYTFKGKWKNKSYKELCFAPKEIAEGLPPMFDLQPGARIKNLQLECALDGIHTSKNNVIDNVFFRDVEEDAITLGENIAVKNSSFWFCNDKCIQMNRANKASITNNKFYYAQGTAILANYGYNIEVQDNYLYQTKWGIRSRTSKSLIKATKNTQEGGECMLMAQDKAILEDWGVNSASSVKSKKCEVNGGRVITK